MRARGVLLIASLFLLVACGPKAPVKPDGDFIPINPYPESVPINHLVPVAGTPLAEQKGVDPLEFVRTIAIARIVMPTARVRLSAGRQELGRAVQAMCFMAGANYIF